MMVTGWSVSSALRPASAGGLPMSNRPGGIRTKVIPLRPSTTLGSAALACAETTTDADICIPMTADAQLTRSPSGSAFERVFDTVGPATWLYYRRTTRGHAREKAIS